MIMFEMMKLTMVINDDDISFWIMIVLMIRWVDLAAFWIYLICFGGYFSYSVAEFPVLQ